VTDKIEIAYWLQKEALCERYKWKPEEIDTMDWKVIAIFTAIARGEQARMELSKHG
jgi:hypothetical protein